MTKFKFLFLMSFAATWFFSAPAYAQQIGLETNLRPNEHPNICMGAKGPTADHVSISIAGGGFGPFQQLNNRDYEMKIRVCASDTPGGCFYRDNGQTHLNTSAWHPAKGCPGGLDYPVGGCKWPVGLNHVTYVDPKDGKTKLRGDGQVTVYVVAQLFDRRTGRPVTGEPNMNPIALHYRALIQTDSSGKKFLAPCPQQPGPAQLTAGKDTNATLTWGIYRDGSGATINIDPRNTLKRDTATLQGNFRGWTFDGRDSVTGAIVNCKGGMPGMLKHNQDGGNMECTATFPGRTPPLQYHCNDKGRAVMDAYSDSYFAGGGWAWFASWPANCVGEIITTDAAGKPNKTSNEFGTIYIKSPARINLTETADVYR